jgi:hypothetical protein
VTENIRSRPFLIANDLRLAQNSRSPGNSWDLLARNAGASELSLPDSAFQLVATDLQPPKSNRQSCRLESPLTRCESVASIFLIDKTPTRQGSESRASNANRGTSLDDGPARRSIRFSGGRSFSSDKNNKRAALYLCAALPAACICFVPPSAMIDSEKSKRQAVQKWQS